MDADRFDTLARSLTIIRSRRGVLAAVLGGMAGLRGLAESSAKNKNKKRGKDKGKKKDGGNPSSPPPPPADPTAPPADPTAPPPPPPCTNSPDSPCGSDASGLCYCRQPAAGGPPICYKAEEQNNRGKCAECPADTTCVATSQPGDFYCFKLCGAP